MQERKRLFVEDRRFDGFVKLGVKFGKACKCSPNVKFILSCESFLCLNLLVSHHTSVTNRCNPIWIYLNAFNTNLEQLEIIQLSIRLVQNQFTATKWSNRSQVVASLERWNLWSFLFSTGRHDSPITACCEPFGKGTNFGGSKSFCILFGHWFSNFVFQPPYPESILFIPSNPPFLFGCLRCKSPGVTGRFPQASCWATSHRIEATGSRVQSTGGTSLT